MYKTCLKNITDSWPNEWYRLNLKFIISYIWQHTRARACLNYEKYKCFISIKQFLSPNQINGSLVPELIAVDLGQILRYVITYMLFHFNLLPFHSIILQYVLNMTWHYFTLGYVTLHNLTWHIAIFPCEGLWKSNSHDSDSCFESGWVT